MPIKEKVYWHDTVEMPAGDALTSLPGRVDVAVIGGGIPGVSAAHQLAKRGAATALLEAESIGWGASSRNGGMALSGLKLDVETVEDRYGKDLTHQLFEDSIASLDTVEQIVQEEQIECGFARSGSLLLANKPAHYTGLQHESDRLASQYNFQTHLISREDLQVEIGSQVYYGGLVDETSAGLNPGQYAAGLAHAAERAGAQLCPATRLLEIRRTPAGFQLKTTRGDLAAGQVLVTTGGYTGPATPQLQRRIIPIGSYIIATQPLPEVLAAQLIPHRRMVFDYKHFLNYYRLSDDNRLVFGGRAAFFPETKSTIRSSAKILQREMVKIFPQLKKTDVEYAWGGTLDFSFDQMPHTGQLEGVHYALGFAGHGVALGTHIGKRVADAMLDGTVADLPYSSYSFPTAPLGLYNGKPWFLPLIGLWHRVLDWIS
ncbi:MAG: FAD-dependent oxidoreductase [Anaerolineales bacterium]|nr:FAD-binding oxidoreductase [Anaerolineae bacterium]PWB55482.1 MAG: FAD-dependent oxidoreductase [Anaerolineales bacterium]